MRIGHFKNGLGDPGGICSYIRRVAEAQTRRGHEVILLDRVGWTAPDADGSIVLTRDDADLIRIAQERAIDVLHLHTAIETPRASVKTVRTMHGHWPYCPSGSRFFKRQEKTCERAYSLVGCTWGHVVDRCGSVRPAQFAQDFQRTWQEMRTLPGTRVLAISEFVKSQMVRSGYPSQGIHVLYLPAPDVRPSDMPSRGAAPKATASFVFLGRLVREKGMEWLLRAATQVKADITIEVAGTGPDRERLGNLAEQLRLGDRIHFHGWLQESKVFQLIADSRAVIFPSIWHEPAGLVTLEAAAGGRALIASRVGAIPEYAGMLGNAILVSPNDVAGLAQAMQRLADDPQEASRLGEAGRRAAQERLSLEAHAEQLERQYAEVIAGG